MVYMDGEKMSKSLGNLVFVDELRDEWDPRAIRLAHHRAPLPRTSGSGTTTLMPRDAARLDRWLGAAAATGDGGAGRRCVPRSTTTSTRPARWPRSTPRLRPGDGVREAAALLGVDL